MTPYSLIFQIAQSEPVGLGAVFDGILVRYGALAALIAIVAFMLFLTWRNQENARIDRQKAEIERTKEDTKRDSVISDYATKYGELSQTVATQGIALAKAEGKVELLSNQLEAERERRQKEHEELKGVIRDLSNKLKANEDELAKLRIELNGKLEEIKALRLERDTLNLTMQSKDNAIKALSERISELEENKRHLEGKVMEQSTQIQSLAKQLAELDPPSATVAQSAVNPAPEKTQPLDPEELSKLEEKDKDNETS